MENKIFEIKTIKKFIDSVETEKLIECLPEIKLQETPIGEGANAFVFMPEEKSFERACVKKIKKIPLVICNSIDDECKLQLKANNLGVKTPITLFSFTTKDGEMYLVMEKVDGYSIKDILKNPDLLPEKFDCQTFCKVLDEQIFKLHGGNTGNGIYHRDLHSGNVMINSEGLPVIIDYGTAIEGSGSDFTYEGHVEKYNQDTKRYQLDNGYFKDDLEMIKLLKNELKGLIIRND